MGADYTFSGWATKNDLRCSDGRTIRRNAFRDQDGTRVSLVWNHKHDEPENVIGHADLENRDDGVYAYCTLNDTPKARNVKALIEHGDIASLSIYANQLKQVGSDVLHGTIREVSVVLAGANPGAVIEAVLEHSGEESTEEAIIYSGDCDIEIVHADKSEEENTIEHSDGNKEENMAGNTKEETPKSNESSKEKTVGEVVESMTEEQQNVMYALIAEALGEKNSNENEEDKTVKHNVFEADKSTEENVISHDAMMEVIADAKRYGSMKESALQHGINDVEYLYPEDHVLNTPPAFIKRDTGWVGTVMNGVKHTPFSRIKSMFADLTEDEARAKGYIKGKMKKEEFFGLLKRSTAPTTVYKKQKMDRDDVVDITDFDVIAWLKGEMRVMLDEEIARAVLIGDGRLASSDDKIPEDHIRPIWKDEALFTIKTNVTYAENATDDQKAKAFIRAAVKARKDYKGSGNPTLFTTEDVLTDLLLLEDLNGRVIYESVDKLATALRVSKIVTVPVMENQTREDSETSKTMKLLGLIVNLADYTIGADKGGAVNMFDDFDIDYNQQKYLIETRCSGALIVPYSAIALETEVTE